MWNFPTGDTTETLRETCGRVVDRDPPAHPALRHDALPRHEGPAVRGRVRRQALPQWLEVAVRERAGNILPFKHRLPIPLFTCCEAKQVNGS